MKKSKKPVPHKKVKPQNTFPCMRCGQPMEEGDRDEDIELCKDCQWDDADFIDSTMELD